MAVTRQHIEFNKLRDFSSLPGPGETLVLRCPGPIVAGQALHSLEQGLKAGQGFFTLLSHAQGIASRPSKRQSNLDLSSYRTITDAIRHVAIALRKVSTRTPLLLFLVNPLPSFLNRTSSLLAFHKALLPVLKRTKRTSIWLFTRDVLAPEAGDHFVDFAEYFLEFSEAGSQLYGQFLKARSISEAGFYLPHRVTSIEGELRFDQGTIPVPAGPVGTELIGDAFEQSYRTIFDAFPNGIVLFSFYRDYREANRKALDLLGYSADELRAAKLTTMIHPSHRIRALRSIVTLRKKKSVDVELNVVRKSGRTVTLDVVASRIPDGRYAAILEDVTQQRKGDEEAHTTADMYRSLVERSPLPQAIAVNRRIVLSNGAFRDAFPWVRADGSNQSTLQLLFGKRNMDVVREIEDADNLSPAGPVGHDATILSPAGTAKEVQVRAIRVAVGEGDGVHLTFVDVTERQKVLRELADSEHRFKTLIDNSLGPVSLVRDGRFTFVNRAFLELFGYLSADHLLSQPVAIIAAPRERETIGAKFATEELSADIVRSVEVSGVTSDGRRLTLNVTAQCVILDGESSLLCYWRDCSEEKKAGADIRRRARELDLADKIMSDLHASIDSLDVRSSGLNAAMRLLNFESGAIFVREGDEFVLELKTNIVEAVETGLSRQSAFEGLTGYAAKTTEPLIVTLPEYPPYLPYKSLFESNGYQTIVLVPLANQGKVIAILLLLSKRLFDEEDRDPGLFHTVATHFAQALGNAMVVADLRAAEERYHRAVDGLADVVYQSRPNGSMVFVSRQVERLLGYTPGDFIRSPELWRSLCHPEDRSLYSERISSSVGPEATHEITYRVLPKGKAAYRWVRETVHYRRDDKGAVLSLQGVVSDITAEIERQREDARIGLFTKELLQNTGEGVAHFDATMKCTEWNAALEAMTGATRESVVGRNVSDNLPGFDQVPLSELFRRVAAGETVATSISVRRPENGSLSSRPAIIVPLKDQRDEQEFLMIVASDRSNVDAYENQIRESEETLRKVIDAMGDALLISDLEGKIWDVNKEFLSLTGYPRPEVVESRFPYPWLVEDEMAKLMTWIAALREQKFLRDFDMSWRRKDGQLVPISLNTTLLRNASGEPVAMLNIARNISERKRFANELAAKNRQIEMLNRIIGKANSKVEFTEVFQSIAEEIRDLLPFDQISVALLSEDQQSLQVHACISTNQASLPLGSIAPLARTVSRVAIQTGEAQVYPRLNAHREFGQDIVSVAEGLNSEINVPILLNDKVLGTFNVGSVTENAYSGPELAYLQPIADHIGALIDRTQLFQRVSDDSTYIHNLLNSIDSVVYTVDPGYRVREVNKAWSSFAVLLGLDHLSGERAIVGRRLDEITVVPQLWNELRTVMPQLFARHLEVLSRDIDAGPDQDRRTFHLVVSPMVINERVTRLVFTFTDITEVKQREAEIRRRNRELIAMNAIATSISQSLNFDQVLDIAANGTMELVAARVVLCYLWDSARGIPVVVRHPGMSEMMADSLRGSPDSGSLAGTVIAGKEPAFISESLLKDGRLSGAEKSSFQALGVNSVACLPLVSKERMSGSLLVGFSDEHDFAEQEAKFLELIGNTIASAIENAQLYAEVQDQVRVVTSLFEMGKRLSGALDRKTVLDVLSDEIRKSIPFTVLAFDAVLPGTNALQRVVCIGEPEMFDDTKSPERPTVVHERVVASGLPFVGTDDLGRPFLAVPVRSESRITALLSLSGTSQNPYDESHLRLLESIANLAGIALDRAALYDDTVTKSMEIEYRNKELDDFTYVVSHDLKEPLITIEGYSKIVLNDYQEHLDAQGKEFLSSVVQSVGRMKKLIDDLLTLSRVGRIAESTNDVSVDATLREVLRDFQYTLHARNATVQVPPVLPLVRYNPTQLGLVFRNLIGNGLKFNDKPEPRIEITASESETEYTFSVRDNGIGIEQQHFEKIFVIFQRLNLAEQYQGTGAGLTIVKKIVENHRGRIWLESLPGQGTTFFFTIPK